MDDLEIHNLRAQPKAKAKSLSAPNQQIIDGFVNALDTLDIGGRDDPKGKGKFTNRRARYSYPNPSWMVNQPICEETTVTASSWEQSDGLAALGTNFQDAVDARDD